MTTHPEDAMTRERALEEARQVADGLRLPPLNREHIARTLWESQRARIHNQDGINARLSWRDKSVPFRFWEHYELDADAVIAALASAQQEPAPAADAEEVTLQNAWKDFWTGENRALSYIDAQRGFKAGFAAALRRYAGDGGVTDEMVEAAWAAYVENCIKMSADKAMRFALEAAARAKSDEKGGAR